MLPNNTHMYSIHLHTTTYWAKKWTQHSTLCFPRVNLIYLCHSWEQYGEVDKQKKRYKVSKRTAWLKATSMSNITLNYSICYCKELCSLALSTLRTLNSISFRYVYRYLFPTGMEPISPELYILCLSFEFVCKENKGFCCTTRTPGLGWSCCQLSLRQFKLWKWHSKILDPGIFLSFHRVRTNDSQWGSGYDGRRFGTSACKWGVRVSQVHQYRGDNLPTTTPVLSSLKCYHRWRTVAVWTWIDRWIRRVELKLSRKYRYFLRYLVILLTFTRCWRKSPV